MRHPRIILAALSAIMLAAGVTAAAALPAHAGAPYSCTVAGFAAQCGPYADPGVYYSDTAQNSYVGNQNVNLTPGETGTMSANGLGDWQATVSAPDNGGAVSEWSNTNVELTQPDNTPQPLSGFTSLVSETDIAASLNNPATSEDIGWDVWGGNSGSSGSNYAYEMMIWSQSINRGTCGGGTVLRTGVAFGPLTFSLCEWGSGSTGEFIWYQSDAAGNPVNSGDLTVDVYAMLHWMIAQGYYPAGYGLNMVTAGSEVCSTGGTAETVTMRKFTLTANGAAPSPSPSPSSTSPSPSPSSTSPSPSPSSTSPSPSPSPTRTCRHHHCKP